ncbi:TfoX/Sxy family protein [Microbacteriaceae bacterium 4G12]
MTADARAAQNELAQRVREAITAHGSVREVRMFGGLSFLVDERLAVAAGRAGDLLVRTDPAEHDALLGQGGEPAFMGKDRPMGPGWLTVPADRIRGKDELARWIAIGVESRGATG